MGGKTERFELQINSQGKADIIDRVESKEKNAICIYNDLGVLPFSSAKAVCDKLNKQEETIQKMRLAFKQKYDYDIEEVVDEVYNWNG